jgi:hypothetical protein
MIKDRRLAMEWWNNLPESIVNQSFADRFYVGRHWKSLTGREIQVIWENLGKPSKIV